MELRIVETRDHSYTLYDDVLNEKYHSLDGAWGESMYVYIEMGLIPAVKSFGDKLNIFEFGFGTGLNTFQTAIVSTQNNWRITYHSIEKYPVPNQIISQLNYSQFAVENASLFEKLHTAAWDKEILINENFNLIKQHIDIADLHSLTESYHVIYFGAFGPRKQPEVWTQEVMNKLFNWLVPRGILVTYCAQGDFKRKLKTAGFVVERLPGPLGKIEMTRATKP